LAPALAKTSLDVLSWAGHFPSRCPLGIYPCKSMINLTY
jgi:hypothetical protein